MVRRLAAVALAGLFAAGGLAAASTTALPSAVAGSNVGAAPAGGPGAAPSAGPAILPRAKHQQRKTSIGLFTASPSTVSAAGGTVHLLAVVQRATSCQFSSTSPLKALPATRSCASGSVSFDLKLPKNTAASARTYHFQVVVHGPSGATNAGPVTVVQRGARHGGAAPLVTADPASQSATAGSSVSFTASSSAGAAAAVQWQVSADGGHTWSAIPGATGSTYTFTAASSENGDEYRAVFTRSGQSTTTSAATLTVSAPSGGGGSPPSSGGQTGTPAAGAADADPVITQQPFNQGVVAGTVVTFTAAASGTPTPTVQWQFSSDGGTTWTNINGATSTSYSFGTGLGQNGQEFRAVFTNAAATATTNAATLSVSLAPQTPSVTLDPASTSVASGTSVTFTAAATGVPTPTVQWQISTDGFTWNNAATSASYSFTATTSEQVRAVFTNSAGSVTTNAATLTVTAAGAAPQITLQPSPETVPSGTQASFTAAASGVPAPSVQWEASTNGGATWNNAGGSATSPTYTFTTNLTESGYEYRAVFTNGSGTATTNTVMLTVNAVAPSITTQPTSQVVASGSNVTFTAGASGDPSPTVQWQVDDGSGWGDIAGATSTSYSFTALSGENGYQYRAVFANSAGSATTNTASLTIGVAGRTSLNWSGYVASGATFSYVAGDWTVPSATCSSGNLYASFWVGIDGYQSGSVEQDGTDSDCSLGHATYYAWYEMYPLASVTLPSGHPVSPGDTMSGSVSFDGSSTWTLTISDLTGAWTYSKQFTETGLSQASAEWVAERPQVNGNIASLSDFGSVTFSGAIATGDSVTGPISSFNYSPFDMINNSGTVLAAPGSLNGSGNGFTDTWYGSN